MNTPIRLQVCTVLAAISVVASCATATWADKIPKSYLVFDYRSTHGHFAGHVVRSHMRYIYRPQRTDVDGSKITWHDGNNARSAHK